MTDPTPPTREGVLDAVLAGTRTEGRRGNGSASPIGARGQRTRAALLEAAHRLFGEQGYRATTVAQIAEAAGVSLGTFYQYFSDRQAILSELVGDWVSRLMSDPTRLWRAREGRAGLERMIAGYVGAVAGDIHFWRAWDEASHTDEQLARVRRELARVLVDSLERELRRAAKAGLVRRDVDLGLAARALTGMADRYVYTTYFFDPPDPVPSPEESARLLAELWVGAVGLKTA